MNEYTSAWDMLLNSSSSSSGDDYLIIAAFAEREQKERASARRRRTINREKDAGILLLWNDYFGLDPHCTENYFRRRFVITSMCLSIFHPLISLTLLCVCLGCPVICLTT